MVTGIIACKSFLRTNFAAVSIFFSALDMNLNLILLDLIWRVQITYLLEQNLEAFSFLCLQFQ